MSSTPFEMAEVRGHLHTPNETHGTGLVLTHGAGSDCNAPILVHAAGAFAMHGFHVLRCDLPFRQRRRSGPPSPAGASADRDGLRAALAALRKVVAGRIFLGGHSYGGRQASILAADEPSVSTALVLFSYPLHPPEKPDRLRVDHFPRLRVPAVFIHGEVDPFCTLDELRDAATAIPAATEIIEVPGAGHDLRRGRIDYHPIVTALTSVADRSRERSA